MRPGPVRLAGDAALSWRDPTPVRDSKTPTARPLIRSEASWSAFVRGVKETA